MSTRRPHDAGAERAVLGAVLSSQGDLWPQAHDLVRAEDFYVPANRTMWEALAALAKTGQPLDSVALVGYLEGTHALERAGGIEGVLAITDRIPTEALLERAGQRVRELAVVRAVIDAALRIAAEGSDPLEDVGGFLDRAEVALSSACSGRISHAMTPRHISDVVDDVYRQLVAMAENGSHTVGHTTGMLDWDRVVGGLVPGEMIVVAGRPGMGKSAWAQSLALGAARNTGKSVLVVSLEMSADQWARRMLSADSGVDGAAIRSLRINSDQWGDLTRSASAISKINVHVLDTMSATMLDIRREARKLAHRPEGLAAIMVDYVGLVEPHEYNQSREREVSAISRLCKLTAKELGVCVMPLAQLNRNCEQRGDKRPMLSDLRESGSLEQDADTVAFVYRDEVYNAASEHKGKAEIIIAKQRSGPTGTISVAWDGARTRFDNLYAGGYQA